MIDSQASQLVVVDLQERLAPAIHDIDNVLKNSVILLTAARRLEIPVLVTEQYPKGLGHTVRALEGLYLADEVFEKTFFAASKEPDFAERLVPKKKRGQIVLCGTEAHICVLQTAMGLRQNGYDVAVVADASSSRNPENAARAYARLSQQGIEIATTEMVLFEWMERANTQSFRELSKLIK